jgi:hypothetical protein
VLRELTAKTRASRKKVKAGRKTQPLKSKLVKPEP